MIKADYTQKRCFAACDEQTIKDGRCSCYIRAVKPVCDRVNNLDNNRCIKCGAKAGQDCEL